MRQSLIIIAALILCMIITSMAQSVQQTPATDSQSKNAAASMPTVDQILDKCVQGVGGKAAVEKLTTRVMKGSPVAPGGRASLEIYQKAPNKFLVIIDSPVSGGRSEKIA